MALRQMVRRAIPARFLPLARRVDRVVSARRNSARSAGVGPTLDARLAYNRFGGYLVPASSAHRPAAHLALSGEVYEAETIDFMRAHCGAGDIVRAGAYFGDFLPALAAACAPTAKIWAFEPNDENHRCAQVTIMINGLTNVVLHRAALGAEHRTAFVRVTDDHGDGMGGASHLVDPADHRADQDQAVELLALDDVIPRRRHVSIIQLDVEGHEQAALDGALSTIRRCLPIVIVEVLPGSDLLATEWFTSNIAALGYRQTDVVDGNVVFRGCPTRGDPLDRVDAG